MTYVLPDLPYSLDALAPSMDAATLELHHNKHHRAYVDKLNAALRDYPEYQKLSIEALLATLHTVDAAVRDAVRKQGGGHANHSLLWQTLTPQGHAPSAALQKAMAESFGSIAGLKQAINEAADMVFGSGWVFLCWRAVNRPLEVIGLPNQDSPWSQGLTPLLGLDLWEHAYYLQYHNLRPQWLEAWWNIIDWRVAEQNWRRAAAASPL
jgi:Fe-Mn family superoxide dismutase